MLRLRSCLKSIMWHFVYYNYNRCGEVEQIAISQSVSVVFMTVSLLPLSEADNPAKVAVL